MNVFLENLMAIKKIAVVGFAFLFGMGLALAKPVQAQEKKPLYHWKTATMALKGIGYGKMFDEILMPAFERETDGDLDLKIFWGGVMGDDKAVIEKMRKGILQSSGLSGQGTFLISPEISVLGLPFLFNDYAEVDYIREKMAEKFDQITFAKKFKILLWLDQGFDQLYSVKTPLLKMEDFKKAKFATWYGPLEGRMLERLGANPVPIDVSQIPTSMRTGQTDAMIAPSIWISGTQLYSKFRYINPMKIRYVPAFVVATKVAWKELDPKYHKRMVELRLDLSRQFCKKSHIEADKYLTALKEYGLICQLPDAKDLEEIRKATTPVWRELVGVQYPKELLDEVLAHLAAYRGR